MLDAKQKEILAALSDLKSLHQGIGSIGSLLRRTKPGSKRHTKYLATLTKLQHEADTASEKISNFVVFGI